MSGSNELQQQIALLKQALAQAARDRDRIEQEKELETDRANRAEKAEQAERDARLQAERDARLQAERVRDRDKLEDGTYFSPIDDILIKVDKDIQNHGFNYSFVRHHHVVIDDNDHRYEETVRAATKQTAIVATGNRNDHTSNERGEVTVRSNVGTISTADNSSESTGSSIDAGVDIFGQYSLIAHSAHLLPNDSICASYWFPVVSFVLSTGTGTGTREETLSWDFMQNCIEGFLDETDDLFGGSDGSSKPRKLPDIGIKHFPTNRIRFIAQETYFDKYPCVIIVPILTLEEVTSWRGGKYEAIVLAGDLKNYDVNIPAAVVYGDIHAARDVNIDDFANYLANKNECNRACYLLEQLILCVCKEFNGAVDLHENLKGKKTNEEIERFDEWKSYFPIKTVPVPVSNDWNDDTMKVRKVSFADSKEKENPAPDPVLLLAKAASNWLKRHDIEILPGCGGNDSSTSHSEEESAQRYSHAAKKPCVVEVNINVNRNDIEEPLSDDEFLLDA